MRFSLVIVLALLAIAFSNADVDPRCKNRDRTGKCKDPKPDDSSPDTSSSEKDESPNAATELSAAKTPTSSSQQLPTTSPNSETTSTTHGNQTTPRQNSSSPSTTTATSSDSPSTGSKSSTNVYDETSSSSLSSSTPTTITPTTEDIWNSLELGINELDGVTIYVCSESTTSTKILPTTPRKLTTISTASTTTTSASTSSTTSLKTSTLSSSSFSTTSPRKTSISSDSTSSKSQMPSTPTSSTTSSASTTSQEKSTTPIPSKTTSANIQTYTISHVSSETSSPSSTSTRTRSSLDSAGSSSGSAESSPTLTQTTPAILFTTSTASSFTSLASPSPALTSTSSSSSSSSPPSTKAGTKDAKPSSTTTSTTNMVSATSLKSSEAYTSSVTDSTSLPKTSVTSSSNPVSTSSERIAAEIMTSTESSSTETTVPTSSEPTSSSSSISTATTGSELTSTLPENISSSSKSSETSSKDTSTKPNAFPTTTSESEATSESQSTVLPTTSSTSTVTKTTSSMIQSTMETSSLGSPSTTSAETSDTETRTSSVTTPTSSKKTTTGASSITETSSSSTAQRSSSSSSATSSGTTKSDNARTSSFSTSSPTSSVTTSGTSESANTDHSTAFSPSVSELTTTQSTPITESVKSQTTTTEATLRSSTSSNVKPTIGGSTSTIIPTTAESSLTEEKISTSSAKPQSSTKSPTTSDMLTSEKTSTSHPNTTDFTTSMVTIQNHPNDDKAPDIHGFYPNDFICYAWHFSDHHFHGNVYNCYSIDPYSSSSTNPASETSKAIPQTSNTENTSPSITYTSSKQTTKSSTSSTSKKSTTPNPSTISKQTSTPKSTTTDPLCSQQCPDGYLIGTSYCFRLFPRLVSYQSALAYCKTVDRQTLASLDKIKDNSDIKLIQESAALQNIDWIYANGIGAKDERFLKKASVYSIYNQSLVSSPIVKTVGISQTFTNISALCVMPQYCETMTCDVEKIFQAYEFYNNFKQTAGTLEPRRSGTVTCIYGNQKATTVTCNALGAIYPNPTNIDCEESATERQLKDTTNDLVSNCNACYKRGTKECQKVMDETNQEVKGYQCICEEPYSMSTCWRTVNNCNSTVCGDHGTCMSEMGHMWCDCKWGYTGDHCDEALDEKYDGDIGFSSAVGATITVGDGIFRFLKICVMGLPKGDGGFDPQSTHQTFRWVCILCANALITLYSNPTLLAIPLIQCRFTFIAIHFFYVQAMVQWLLEGFNVNQVLRCVHLNEWERDINGNKSLGVRIWPRFIVSVIGVAVFVLIPFTAGWNKLAASWTCVGVICQETLHVWFPIFFGVLVIVLWAGAVYENSALIKVRRPLLGFRLDYEIERRVGWEAGKIFQKCRDNELMCFIGVILLVAQWVAVIISSDHRDEKFYGMVTIVVSGIYSAFSTYQEIMTNPEDRANFYTLLQRFLPYRAAPAYNPETTWTIDEVKEYFNTPKKEREEQYEGFINRNQQLLIHHKWDIRMNEFLAEDPKLTIDEALIKVFTAEMNELKKNNGTGRDKLYIQATFVAYCDTIPHFEPRPTEKLEGHLELVTLAAEDPVQGTRLAKFFIVPTHHIFEPEIPEKKKNTTENRKKKNLRRRMLKNIEEDIFKLSIEEIHAQAVFANSAILFSHYGNDVVR